MNRISHIITAVLTALLVTGLAAAGVSHWSGPILVESYGAATTCATASGEGDICAASDIEANGALDIAGASTLTGAVTMGSTIALTGSATLTAGYTSPVNAIITTASLDSSDCGSLVTVSAGIDTKTITLPATIDSCELTIVYIGADGGALVDISPNASDGIHGTCTLAASALEFSGTDDADIGLTKNTVNTGDMIKLYGDGAVGWYVTGCSGIWANN